MGKKKKTRQAPENSDELRLRVVEAKKHLPNGILPLYIHKWPEYDTYKKRSRITNVVQLRITDQDITEKLETLVTLLKKETN